MAIEKIKHRIIKPVKITKIKTEVEVFTSVEDSHYTTLHCRYTTSPKYGSGWWVNICENSFLEDVVSGSRIKMISAFNIPFSPAKHYFKKYGESLSFILVFPHVPKDWAAFKFIEVTSGSPLSSAGILRKDSGVYSVTVFLKNNT
jgi:hypothetical protein